MPGVASVSLLPANFKTNSEAKPAKVLASISKIPLPLSWLRNQSDGRRVREEGYGNQNAATQDGNNGQM